MTDRDFAITNKAACYGVSALTVVSCALFHIGGSQFAFFGGLFAGIFAVPVAEMLIVIPKKEQE